MHDNIWCKVGWSDFAEHLGSCVLNSSNVFFLSSIRLGQITPQAFSFASYLLCNAYMCESTFIHWSKTLICLLSATFFFFFNKPLIPWSQYLIRSSPIWNKWANISPRGSLNQHYGKNPAFPNVELQRHMCLSYSY